MAFNVITITPPSDITGTTAECEGDINPTGGSTNADLDAWGIIYSDTNPTPDETDSPWIHGGAIGATFTSSLVALTPGTTYYYRAFCHDETTNISYYGDVETFTTVGLNEVTTAEVTDRTDTSAVCGGEVIENDEPAADAYGCVWNTAGNPTVIDNDGITIDGSGLGVFVSDLTDLLPGTTYFVRAYATNEAGTAYGEEREVTTLSTDELTEYDLGTMVLPAGELHIYAKGIDGLTPPSKLLLESISPKREKIEGNPDIGKVQVENMTLVFRDEGDFWKDLAASNFYVRVMLNGALFTFGRGRIQKPTWEEYYIRSDGEDTRRTATINLVSNILQMQDLLVDDVIEAVPTITKTVNAVNYKFVNLLQLVHRCVAMSFPSEDITLDDIIIPNEDMHYKKYGILEVVGFSNLVVMWGLATPSARKYFNPADDLFLAKKYDSALSLVAAIANNFGFIPRMKYNNDLGKHQLYLLTKRRRDSLPVAMGPLVRSERSYSILVPDRYRFFVDGEPAEDCWRLRSKIDTLSAAPTNQAYDVNMELLWNKASYVSDGAFSADDYKRFYIIDGAGTFHRVENAAAYSYSGEAYDYESEHMTEVLFLYNHEFWQGEKLGYDRTFKQINGSRMPTDLIEVSEDGEEFNCYINGIVHDVSENETTVEIIEV